MFDVIFGPAFKRLLTSTDPCVSLNNIDRDLVELAVAGIYGAAPPTQSLIWVVGVNENLGEKAAKLRQWLPLVTPNPPNIRFYSLPFEDPYINTNPDPLAVGRKVKLIADIMENKPMILLTTLPALSLKIEKQSVMPAFFQRLDVDGEIDRDALLRKLTEMGYRSRSIVEEQGDMAWRGSIVDVFPIDQKLPLRIEIEDDTVVSMRIFDPDSQKSLKRITNTLLPLSRFFLDYPQCSDYLASNQHNMVYLTELIKHNRLVVSDKKKITDEFSKLLNHYENLYQMITSPGHAENPLSHTPPAPMFAFPFQEENVFDIEDTWDDIASSVFWRKLPKSIHEFNLEDVHALQEKIHTYHYQLYIFSEKGNRASLEQDFTPTDFISAPIPCSFENKETRTIFLTDKHFFYIDKPSTQEKSEQLKSEQWVDEMKPDDLVVHNTHGVGKFVGFKKLAFEGHLTEFLKLEYAGKEYLYVPVYELDVLTKYAAFEGNEPKLDKMGGNSFALKKKRAQKSIIHFARELLELYAMRKAIKGTAYFPDSELEMKMAEEFQYVETQDQKRAIKEVYKDLEAEFPMDRLICGDVSFGKTEVALRAALRVVVNSRQVAILCPTTILACQHYATFKKRFANYPISIAMLSRMVSEKEKKEIYKELASGNIDIVIGTHALISAAVKFKRLGLYIIDEEQRFGVFQKEKLKKMREDVDVLSMSATPIPRTLSLSLAGLQDISTIRTPPLGRLAVKNFVGQFSREIIVSAILNETQRDGQVFIVYNDIDKIYTFQNQLAEWLPAISSVVVHAQLDSQKIENDLMDFIDKKYRVLLSTTIIENGIDIPCVNTMIVLDADRFGLTQLYQLRGRIGRSTRQAYAYFLVKSLDITEKAKARLEAIRDFADLGSGYKLAEFDLKLRGAGSLLGNKQHGHIEALGFDYYHQLLEETIKELKGEITHQKEGKINYHFSYSIEAEYIKNSAERITLYRRVLEADDFERIEELRNEMTDRYGRPQSSMEKIFFAGMMRVLTKKYLFEQVDVYDDRVIIQFPDTPGNRVKLFTQKELPPTFTMEPFGSSPRTRVFYFEHFKPFALDFMHYWETL